MDSDVFEIYGLIIIKWHSFSITDRMQWKRTLCIAQKTVQKSIITSNRVSKAATLQETVGRYLRLYLMVRFYISFVWVIGHGIFQMPNSAFFSGITIPDQKIMLTIRRYNYDSENKMILLRSVICSS